VTVLRINGFRSRTKRSQEFNRLHHRQQVWLIVFGIPRNQAIHLSLNSRDHLYRIFKISIVKIQSLLNSILLHRNDFKELQQIRNDRTSIGGRLIFLN